MTSYNPDAVMTPLTPDTVLQERYRIVRQLGKGGMGAVYEAIDQRLGKPVALKETLSSEPSIRRQFEREARLLAGMQHPALPQVSDHFVEGDRAFLVMQFIGGVDLAKIISQQPGPLPRDQVIAWADQLLDALIYLHTRDRQVIHRDIKPHNLKLNANGQIALLDFGLAKAQVSDPSVTASQAFFGYTRHYAPLEQIQDQRTDPRSDIYALGATLYHLLTGTKPPDAMVRATAVLNAGADPLQLADKVHAAVGPELAAILNKAMAQRPEERYASAQEFREALRRIGRTKTELNLARPVACEREHGISPTVHISDLPSLRDGNISSPQLALIGSARRFGPAGVTVVLALTAMLAAGIIYGSQKWFPETAKQRGVGTSSETAPVLRQTSGMRTSEKARSESVAAKPKNFALINKPENGLSKKDEITARNVASPIKLIKSTRVNSQPADARGSDFLKRDAKNGLVRRRMQTVGAPSIRFPSPELREHSPSPSPDSRVRTFGSTSALPANAPPKFFRAADGTQIVKFSDGSTQYVKPGRNKAEADTAYR